MSERILLETGKSNLLETLAYLASMKVQERYIVGGTTEEYIVPDDLIEDLKSEYDFFQFKDKEKRIEWLKNEIGESCYKEIEELLVLIGSNESFLEKYTNQNLSELIQKDSVWCQIRSKANKAISSANFDLEVWERVNA
ncbi:MAG: hypothetical protein RPT95_10160 [Candidatus Sedimenticola sp. (ex Thyasira tokunagai)]